MKASRCYPLTVLKCGLVLLLTSISHSTGRSASSPSEAIEKGREFLVSLLDTNLDLLPEYRGAKVYWVFQSLQDDSGGWITDYDAAGKTIGVANVETTCLAILGLEELLFQDDFRGKLREGWSWIREHREAWRVGESGLEVRLEPGNMWGPQNDARNVLVRPAPDASAAEIEVAVTVESYPTNQYEQVDLVWYFDDSDMVKLGEELVDGKLSVVMGREEHDHCRTIAIIPLQSSTVRLRVLVHGNDIRGQFRTPSVSEWREVGRCTLPSPTNVTAKVSLQFYQGLKEAGHWARVSDFRILKHP